MTGFEAVDVFEKAPPIFLSKGRGLCPGLLIYVVMTARAAVGSTEAFAAEDGSGDESNDKADGQGLHEGVGHVDEGVLVIRMPQAKARPKEIWPARVLSR